MSKLILLATLLLETLLVGTRFLASRLKRTDRYGSETEKQAQWENVPFDFKVDYSEKLDADKGVLKPPKVKGPRSRVV